MSLLDKRAVTAAVWIVVLAFPTTRGSLASAEPPPEQSLAVSVVNTPLPVAPVRHEAVTLMNLGEGNDFRRMLPDGRIEPAIFVVPAGKEFILTHVGVLTFPFSGPQLVHIYNSDPADPELRWLIYYVVVPEALAGLSVGVSNTNIEGGIAFAAGRRVRTNIGYHVLILHGHLR